MARPDRPGLTGACGCTTPWVAGLGSCCAKRLELVADFHSELELTQKVASDATYGDTTYGIVHSPPPVSIRRRYVVLGDRSPPAEAPDSPASRGSTRRLFTDERGSDGILRQDMDTYQLELQRKLELQLVRERGEDEEARPGYTSLYGTLPKEPVPHGVNTNKKQMPDVTPPLARVRRAHVADSPGLNVVRRQAPPEAQQLRDAYIAAAGGNSAPLEVLRAATTWSGEAEYALSFAPDRPASRRRASDSTLAYGAEYRRVRRPCRLDPTGGRAAVRQGVRHCRHVPLGRRRAVLQRKRTNNLLVQVMFWS